MSSHSGLLALDGSRPRSFLTADTMIETLMIRKPAVFRVFLTSFGFDKICVPAMLYAEIWVANYRRRGKG